MSSQGGGKGDLRGAGRGAAAVPGGATGGDGDGATALGPVEAAGVVGAGGCGGALGAGADGAFVGGASGGFA